MSRQANPRRTTGPECKVDVVPEVRINGIGRVILGVNWTYRVMDDSWRLYLMSGDGAAIRYRGYRFELPGDCPVLVPAWLPFECMPGAGIRQDYIKFSAPDIPSKILQKHCTSPAILPYIAGLEESVLAMGDYSEKEGAAHPLHGTALLRALAAASSALDAYIKSLSPTAHAQIEKLFSHMHPVQILAREVSYNPLEPWSVDRLAEKACCSREHLSRLFQKHLHQSPARFIREQRLIRAADMLLHSEDSIESIAAKCGFGDRFSFSRAFTRLYKKGPGQYRGQREVQPPSG